MKNFTLQRDLGKYSERWGCYSTSIINIVENEIGRKLTDIELSTVIGVWFRSQSIYVANYHNHRSPIDRSYLGSPKQWDQQNDPEWHFFVGNPDNALLDAFYAIGKKPTTKKAKYQIVLYNVYAGHYCLNIGAEVINPDPTINVKGTEIKEVIKMEV